MSVNTRRPSILFHGTVISQTKRQNWDDWMINWIGFGRKLIPALPSTSWGQSRSTAVQVSMPRPASEAGLLCLYRCTKLRS
jgi:hypothetical protein